MNSEEDNQEQQQNQQRSEPQQQQQEEKPTRVEPETAAGPSQSLGRAAPRSGALLVEVYGRVVRKQHNLFSPNQVLLDFTKYLVSFPIARVESFHVANSKMTLNTTTLCSMPLLLLLLLFLNTMLHLTTTPGGPDQGRQHHST
jgi:hypothetical protein